MKKLTLIIIFLLININLFSQTEQNNYSGKFYVAKISASCKKMVNGGCMIYSYCVMKFAKDSVEVSYPTKASCSPSEVEKKYNDNNIIKKYKWIIKSDKLVIKGFEDLNKYSFSEKNVEFVKTLYADNAINLNKSVKKTEINIRKITGFLLDNSQYIKTKVPLVGTEIEVQGTIRKTLTDEDGKFEIEVVKGEKLIVSGLGIKRKITILITDRNCYRIDLDTVIFEESLISPPEEYLEEQRELEQKMLNKIKEGFYDCKD